MLIIKIIILYYDNWEKRIKSLEIIYKCKNYIWFTNEIRERIIITILKVSQLKNIIYQLFFVIRIIE